MSRQKREGFDAWRRYDSALLKRRSPVSDQFDREQFVQGTLRVPPDAARILIFAERIEFASKHTAAGFITFQFGEAAEADFRASSHFRVIAGPLAEMLVDCAAQLSDPVAKVLGSPWRILNTRAWVTPPIPFTRQMYSVHCDGMPIEIFKIMIYFTPMDAMHGGLEIKANGAMHALTGPAGSWVLFYNSALEHRGAPGLKELRASAELTIARASEFDLRLHQPGINAHWPRFP